jgi:hypothetical protein
MYKDYIIAALSAVLIGACGGAVYATETDAEAPITCHADVPEGATANQWLPCWEDAGPATGCYGNQSDCKVGQSCVITNFETTASGFGYCY